MPIVDFRIHDAHVTHYHNQGFIASDPIHPEWETTPSEWLSQWTQAND